MPVHANYLLMEVQVSTKMICTVWHRIEKGERKKKLEEEERRDLSDEQITLDDA